MDNKEKIINLIKIKCICKEPTIKKRINEIKALALPDEAFKIIYNALVSEECLSCHGLNRLDSHLQKFNGFCAIHGFLSNSWFKG